jgi:hypothetical protein
MNTSTEHKALEMRASMIRSMGGVALLGMSKGMADDARTAMRPVAVVTGDEEALQVYLAFAASLGGDAAPARELLALRQTVEAGREYLDAVLAISLCCAGDGGWDAALGRVLALSGDAATRSFAHQITEVAREYA